MSDKEKNMIIAKFEGLNFDPRDESWFIDDKDWGTPSSHLRYHSSMTKLMKPIEKIEKMGYNVVIGTGWCKINGNGYIEYYGDCNDDGSTDGLKMKLTYLAIVEFIIWHNLIPDDER